MNYLNIIRAIYGKPTANVTVNGERLFFRNKTRMPTVTSAIIPEVLATATRQEKEC